MTHNLDDVINQALKLDAEERRELIERMLETMPPVPPLHPEWEAEIARRIADMEAGRSQGVPAEQALAEMRAMIDARRTGTS